MRLENGLGIETAAPTQADAELKRMEEEEAEAKRFEKEAAAAVPAEAEAGKTKSEPMWNDWGNPSWIAKKWKKSKKSASTALGVYEPPPPPSPPPAEPESDSKCDSLIPEAVIEDAPAVAESTHIDEEDSWSDWGAVVSSSKKNRRKKGKTLAGCEIPLPNPEAVVGSDLIEPEQESSVAALRALDDSTEVVAISSSAVCPSRQEHLSESDGWKSCKSCELYVRQIAFKLHLTGRPDVNGSDVT
jgi:hypothetical protein